MVSHSLLTRNFRPVLWDARDMKPMAPEDSGDLAHSDEEQQAALDRLSRQALECGLYDRNETPEGGSDE